MQRVEAYQRMLQVYKKIRPNIGQRMKVPQLTEVLKARAS